MCFIFLVKVYFCFWKWYLYCGIVFLEEDYLDYCLIEVVLCFWLYGLSEYFILIRINVVRFCFRDFMVSLFVIIEVGWKILILYFFFCELGFIYILYFLYLILFIVFVVN